MLVVMEADRQWMKYRSSVVAGRPPAISPLLALLFALMCPSLECKSPSQCFTLFLTEELVGDIVEETNHYALELQEKREPVLGGGKLAKWVKTTINEMYTFLVTVLLMGIVKNNSLREY